MESAPATLLDVRGEVTNGRFKKPDNRTRKGVKACAVIGETCAVIGKMRMESLGPCINHPRRKIAPVTHGDLSGFHQTL